MYQFSNKISEIWLINAYSFSLVKIIICVKLINFIKNKNNNILKFDTNFIDS